MTEVRLSTLPQSFFTRDTHTTARGLLGKLLLRTTERGTIAVRIVEVEAYVGTDDLACHASKGRTPRTEVMFGPPGMAYVYLIYGMYHCLNVVTEKEGFPAAVLIRAAEPVWGEELLSQRAVDAYPTRGPGKLTKALGITRLQNGHDLKLKSELYLADDGVVIDPALVRCTPRIGVDYAGKCSAWPWRYILTSSPYVSGTRKQTGRVTQRRNP